MAGSVNPFSKFSNGLPDRVKVGPVEYQVILSTNLTSETPEGEEVPLFGMVNFKRSEITIDEELTPMMQWQCLWHELVHIMFEQLGFEENECEGQVDALAYKLLEVMADNNFLFPAQESNKLIGYTPFEALLAHGE